MRKKKQKVKIIERPPVVIVTEEIRLRGGEYKSGYMGSVPRQDLVLSDLDAFILAIEDYEPEACRNPNRVKITVQGCDLVWRREE